MDSHSRKSDAAQLERLDKLAKRREMEGNYTDADICRWAAMRLRDLMDTDQPTPELVALMKEQPKE